MGTIGLLSGGFLVVFNGWRLATIWAANMPGIQLFYWVVFITALLLFGWSTTHIGRNAIASNSNLSQTTIGLLGFLSIIAVILAILTV